MYVSTFRRAAALGFFALPVYAYTPARADLYYGVDTTISKPITGLTGVYIGYKSQSDYAASKNPSSPNVSLIQGGSVGGSVNVFNGSSFTMSAGSIGSASTPSTRLNAYNTCRININGGSIVNDVYTHDSSMMTLSAGVINGTVFAGDGSALTMTGGAIGVASSPYSQISGTGGASISVRGGKIFGDLASSNGSVTLSGGSVSGLLIASGSSSVTYSGGAVGGRIYLADAALLDIEGGSDLLATPLSSDFAGKSEYALSGTLKDNSALNNLIYIDNGTGARLLFNGRAAPLTVAPAPGSLLVSLLGFAGIGVGLNRRRR